MNRIYAGIGARATPGNILKVMEGLAVTLAHEGYMLRSGAAEGADQAFERGCDLAKGPKEIFLPWKGYNGHMSPHYHPTPDAMRLALDHHPAKFLLKQGAAKLHGRNSHILMGLRCDTPVAFVICWTEQGRIWGGTGQALRIAEAKDIPVFNLGHPKGAGRVVTEIYGYLRTLKEQTA